MVKLNAGVVGAGSIAEHVHFPVYEADQNTNLTSIAEVSDTRRREAKKKYSPNSVYEDGLSMIEEESLDIVSICTPPPSHKTLFVRAAENGCHIYCEKPMALNTDETKAMVDAADRNSIITQIGYTIRYANNYQKILKWNKNRLLGTITEATFHCLVNPPGDEWRYNQSVAGGGILTENCPHWLDFYLELFDGNLSVIEADLRSIHTSQVEDHASVTFSSSDSTLRIVAKWVEPGMTYKTLKKNTLVSTEGEIEFNREYLDGNIRGHGLQFKYGQLPEISLGPLFQQWFGASENVSEKPLIDFIDHVVRGSADTETPAKWGHRVTELREQIYRKGVK